jgi:hypothetical protein
LEKFDENIFIVHVIVGGDPELCYGHEVVKKGSKDKFRSERGKET